MSAAATAWAWKMIAAGCVRNPAAKLTLLKLSDRADDAGKCWPGHERTALDCGLSERGARKAFEELERDGLIVVERRRDMAGRDLSNVYRLPLREGEHSSTPMATDGEGEHSSTRVEPRDGGAASSAPESNKIKQQKHFSSACTSPPCDEGAAEPPLHTGKTGEGEASEPTPKPASRGARRAPPPVGENGRFVRPYPLSGVDCWDLAEAAAVSRLIAEHGEDAVAAAAKKIAEGGRKPLLSYTTKILTGQKSGNDNRNFIPRTGYQQQPQQQQQQQQQPDDPLAAAAERSRQRRAAAS